VIADRRPSGGILNRLLIYVFLFSAGGALGSLLLFLALVRPRYFFFRHITNWAYSLSAGQLRSYHAMAFVLGGVLSAGWAWTALRKWQDDEYSLSTSTSRAKQSSDEPDA